MIPRLAFMRARSALIIRNTHPNIRCLSEVVAKQPAKKSPPKQVRFETLSPELLIDLSNKTRFKGFTSYDVGMWWSQMSKKFTSSSNKFSLDANSFNGPKKHLLKFIPRLLSKDLANITSAVVNLSPVLSYGINQKESASWDMVLKSLIEKAKKDHLRFHPGAISNTLHSLAKNRTPEPELFALFEKRIVGEKDLSQYSSQMLAQIAWAYTVSNYTSPELFNSLEKEIKQKNRLKEFTPQGLAMLSWSFAKSSQGSTDFFHSIAEASLSCGLDQFEAQGIANIAWSLARSNPNAESTHNFLGAIATHMKMEGEDNSSSSVKSNSPQALSNILWSCATSQYYQHDLFEMVDQLVKEFGFEPFNHQEVANILWAFSKSGRVPSKYLFDALEEHLLNTMDLSQFNEEEITSIIYSFGLFKEPVNRHLSVPSALLDEMLSRKLECFQTSGVSNVVRAVAELGLLHNHDLLNDAMVQDFTLRKESYSIRDMTELLLGLSYGGTSKHETLCRDILLQLQSQPADAFDHKTMCCLMWCCAILDIQIEPFFGFKEWMSKCEDISWNPTELYQLHQWQLSQPLGSPTLLPETLRKSWLESSISLLKDEKECYHKSDFERKVAVAMSSMEQLTFVEACILEDVGYSVDFVVTIKDKNIKIILELDGLSHFLLNSQIPTGLTLMKRRHLASKGYKLVALPIWEWKDQDREQRLLTSILNAANM